MDESHTAAGGADAAFRLGWAAPRARRVGGRGAGRPGADAVVRPGVDRPLERRPEAHPSGSARAAAVRL
jgi:hypothetical protein